MRRRAACLLLREVFEGEWRVREGGGVGRLGGRGEVLPGGMEARLFGAVALLVSKAETDEH